MIPSTFCELTPEQAKKIKRNLNEDEYRFVTQIKSLKMWMDRHPFIPKQYEVEMLEIFLRACKYDMEATKQKLENYFVNKTKCPESFKVYSFEEIDWETLNNFYFLASRKLTPEGYKVTFAGFREVNINSCNIEVMCKFIWISAIYKANLSTLDAGNVLVINMNVFSPTMVVQLMTPFLKQTVKLLQTTFPFRTKQIFIINAPGYAENFINVCKMFLNDKIKNRVIIEAGDDKMKASIPNYCIPSDFGGTGDAISDRIQEWFSLLKHYEPWFKQHEKVIPLIDKIPKELFASSSIDDEMGTQGSFRQLSID